MPDEDKNFGGPLVLDFSKWWRHMQAKNTTLGNNGNEGIVCAEKENIFLKKGT